MESQVTAKRWKSTEVTVGRRNLTQTGLNPRVTPMWVWVQHRVTPKWSPGTWKQGRQPAVPWRFNLTHAHVKVVDVLSQRKQGFDDLCKVGQHSK